MPGDGDQPGSFQNLHVMRDRGLTDLESIDDVAGADRGVLCRDEAKDLESRGIGKRFEPGDDRLTTALERRGGAKRRRATAFGVDADRSSCHTGRIHEI